MSNESLSLCEKYRPLKIEHFVGLAEPKLVLQKIAAQLCGRALLFEGKSGSGKTAMAYALAAAIPAEVHRLPANECTRDNVAKLWMTYQAKPKAGYRVHLILVDQADTLNKAQQIDLRSKIDGSESLDHVIWVFAGTNTAKLDAGFRGRCTLLKFSTYGNSTAAARLLETVWRAEGPTFPPPNFARIVKDSNGSVRAALMEVEKKLALS